MKNASAVLIAASTLAVLGDFLFHDSLFGNVPVGISLLVMLSALAASSLILAFRTKWPAQWKSLWFLVPPLMLAVCSVWRDSVILRWLDISVLFFFLFTSSLSMQGLKLMTSGLMSYFNTAWCVIDSLFVKPCELLFRDMQWTVCLSDGTKHQLRAVSKGLMIAAPLVLVFGGLFIAADAAFEGLVRKSFQFDVGNSFSHLAVLTGFFWCVAGFLYDMFNGKFEPTDSLSEFGQKKMSLGIVEVGVILGSLNLLFLAFVVVQAQYFFGGANLVEITNGLTYADYARRGFFELVTVAALVLPILLGLDWLLEKTNAMRVWIFRGLTSVQIGLLFVIMVSAVQRMRLYQFEYGMTELRLYTTAFMGWLAVLCVIFIATVLRGRRDRFAFASIMSGLLVVFGLHVVNPDAFIVKTNIAHAKAGKAFDAVYALTLSSDAVPTLVNGLNSLPEATRNQISEALGDRYKGSTDTDWRGWNWSRSQARHAVTQLPKIEKKPVENTDKKVTQRYGVRDLTSLDLRMKPRG